MSPLRASFHTQGRKRLQDMFGVGFEFLLYDVTSTYFEGQALGNTKARRGYSRDKRPDCKQVERRIGRWLGKYSTAERHFTVEVIKDEKGDKAVEELLAHLGLELPSAPKMIKNVV